MNWSKNLSRVKNTDYLFAGQEGDFLDGIKGVVEEDEPLFIAGDFNDWTGEISKMLENRLGCSEAFIASSGRHARTFPAAFPLLSLDRIYTRNLEIVSATTLADGVWKSLSDHAAILGEFELIDF